MSTALRYFVPIGLASVGVYLTFGFINNVSTEDLRDAIGTIAEASATLLGFLVSGGALLYAVANTTLARNLQRTGHFRDLLESLFVDAACFLVALVLGLASTLLPTRAIGDSDWTYFIVGVHATLFASILAYLLLLPVGWKMWVLLSNLRPEGPLE